MATTNLWRDWIQTQDIYSPELENGKAIGDALKDFEESFLAVDTSLWSIQADHRTRRIESSRIDYSQLVKLSGEDARRHPSFTFHFINRILPGTDSEPALEDAHKLQISAESLRLLVSRYNIPPSFLFALSRYYLPHGQGFRRYEDHNGKLFWNQWYFLPFRVQVPCTDPQRSHEASTTGRNQMNPFHYLHLPDEKVDIRGSQIAIYLCHDGRSDATTVTAFNFMSGEWRKIIEEPQIRMTEAFEHPSVPYDPMSIHLVFLTTVVRWWNNALHSVNEQLIAYEQRLQEEADDESATNTFYDATSKALHAMAAHVHRYGAELDSLQETATELGTVFARLYGPSSASLGGIEHVKSQLKATGRFVKEQEKKIQNILALVSVPSYISSFLVEFTNVQKLFNRMQIANDRIVVSNGKAMNEIMKATRDEAAFSREIALRSQQLSEAMKKDSVSMRTIAILTMFFLPATSFSALLAMPFFATNKYLTNGRQIWIWVVLTVPTTAVVYMFYHLWRTREEKRVPKIYNDMEMGKIGGGKYDSITTS